MSFRNVACLACAVSVVPGNSNAWWIAAWWRVFFDSLQLCRRVTLSYSSIIATSITVDPLTESRWHPVPNFKLIPFFALLLRSVLSHRGRRFDFYLTPLLQAPGWIVDLTF